MTNKINFKSLKKNTIRYSLVSLSLLAIIVLLISVSAYKATEEETTVNEPLSEKVKKQTILVTREWQVIKKQSTKNYSKLEEVLKNRKEYLNELITAKQYNNFYTNVLPDEIIDNIPANLSKYVEKRAKNITGKLTYAHGHEFDSNGIKNSVDLYYINRGVNGDFEYQLFPSTKNDLPKLRNGDTVTLNNSVRLDDIIVFQPYEIKVTKETTISDSGHSHNATLASTKTSPSNSDNVLVSAATTEKTAVVILMNFNNDQRQPYTPEQVRAEMFTNPRSVDAFYEETSFNSLGFAPGGSGVTGWVTISSNNLGCDKNWSKWGQQAETAAKSAGYNISAQYKVYFWPRLADCGFGGLAWMPGNQSYINGSNSLYVLGHELGHNLGTDHASSYNCTFEGAPSTFSEFDSCSGFSEYGDSFDIMGGMGQFTTYRKAEMGYLSASNIKTVTQSGEYIIKPLNFKTDQTQSLRIKRDPNSVLREYIYLDYRQPSVIDNYASTHPVVNGVSIHIAPDYSTDALSFLLDANPSTSSMYDAALGVGKSVTDPRTNIKITTVALNSDSATVKVEFLGPTCLHARPTISVQPSEQWGNAGDTLTYTATVTNNDNTLCDTSTFGIKSFTDTLPTGFTLGPTTTTFELAPGQSQSKNFTVTSSSDVAAGFYSLSFASYNIAIPSLTSNNPAFTYYKISGTDIIAPTVTIEYPADGQTVSGRVNIIANATDDMNVISKMELYIDGALIKSYSGVSRFVYTWSAAGKGKNASYGTKQIKVVAYDPSGGVGQSTITVNVVK